MAAFYDQLNDKLIGFIQRQHVFFTATAAEGARINLSPKGLDGFRVLGPKAVAYMDWTGSGNETAAHINADGRLTIMLCAFDGPPNILRIYGKGRVLLRGTPEYEDVLASAFNGEEPMSARQIVVLDIESVQTSCGYGVPLYEYKGERPSMPNWASQHGDLPGYRQEHNLVSIDGLPTGYVEIEPAE